jgi:hypothetical protein
VSADPSLGQGITAADSTTVSRLADILLAGLEKLSAAGETDFACRLAGQAYVASREVDCRTARRFDGFLHRASRRLTW